MEPFVPIPSLQQLPALASLGSPVAFVLSASLVLRKVVAGRQSDLEGLLVQPPAPRQSCVYPSRLGGISTPFPRDDCFSFPLKLTLAPDGLYETGRPSHSVS